MPKTRDKSAVAHDLARSLASIGDVDGVCLFGSLARGEPDDWSDIDLLVVGGPELRPTLLLEALPEHLRSEKVSLICYSADELRRLFDGGSTFLDHIRHEGRILHDRTGFLENILSGSFEPSLDIHGELAAELERLRLYDDVALYNDNFLFGLAQMYAIGKSVVILGLLADGNREYARDRAFAAFAERHPDLRDAVAVIKRLRPFYRRVTKRRPEPLPYPYTGVPDELGRAADAIRRVAAAVDERAAA